MVRLGYSSVCIKSNKGSEILRNFVRELVVHFGSFVYFYCLTHTKLQQTLLNYKVNKNMHENDES